MHLDVLTQQIVVSGLRAQGRKTHAEDRVSSFTFIFFMVLLNILKSKTPAPGFYCEVPEWRQSLILWCCHQKWLSFPSVILTRLQKNHAFEKGQALSLKQKSEISSEQKNPKGAISWPWSSAWCKVTYPWKISRGDRPCLLWKNAGCVMATLQEVYVSLCF